MKNIGSHLQLCEMIGFVNIVVTVTCYCIYCILMVVSRDPRAYNNYCIAIVVELEKKIVFLQSSILWDLKLTHNYLMTRIEIPYLTMSTQFVTIGEFEEGHENW